MSVLYLDMDGTVRWGLDELGRFVNGPDDVRLFDEVPDLLARYKEAGWRIVAVSNQGGIALGHVDKRSVIAAMLETQKQAGDAFDKILFCSHHPDASDPEMAVCWCRKPRPGLVLEAAFTLAEETSKRGSPEIYPPHLALMVGDRSEDKICAEAANVSFMEALAWRAGAHAL